MSPPDRNAPLRCEQVIPNLVGVVVELLSDGAELAQTIVENPTGANEAQVLPSAMEPVEHIQSRWGEGPVAGDEGF